MEFRQKTLKKGIISSVLLHGESLGLVSEVCNPWAEEPTRSDGWSSNLKGLLKNYFRARRIDRLAPDDPQRLFLRDVANLMAGLEESMAIFINDPKEAIIDIISRLMAFEGWITSERDSWANYVSEVDREEPLKDRSKKYRKFLKDHWDFRIPSVENHFEDAELWVQKNLGDFPIE